MYLSSRVFRRYLSAVPNPIPSVLNGVHCISSHNLPVVSHNNNTISHFSPLDNVSDKIPAICEDAHAGFHKWRAVAPEERRDILMKAASIIEKNVKLYVDAHTAIGGPESFAKISAHGTIANCREYASHITRPPGANLLTKNTAFAFTQSTAIGPVLAIAAWNAPAILWSRAIIAPLAAGCSVVIKSSEKDPLTPFLLTQHLLEAGVEPRALQLVQVGPGESKSVVEKTLANMRVKMVNFTGSTAVGRQIATVAAQNLKPALLELGGKNVFVVCKDSDLRKAAATAIFSAWFHKGQVCMCLDTAYVHEDVYDEFLVILRQEAAKAKENPDMRLNQRDESAAEKVEMLVSEAVESGASVLFGHQEENIPSNCPPVILTDVSESTRLAAEETFGPVFSVSKFSDLGSVISKINDQPHGLKASVWSTDILAAIDIAKKLDFGGVHINGSTVHDEPTVPHGGVKESGSGRFNSAWGIEEFQYTKAITISR